MQDSLVAFGAFGMLSLVLAVGLMMALPEPARSWTACGFLALVAWWMWRLFRRTKRAARGLMEDDSQVVIGKATWPRSAVKEVRAVTWMRQGAPGFQVDLVLLETASPILIMQGAGHPLPEGVLRRFCAGCGLRLEMEVIS